MGDWLIPKGLTMKTAMGEGYADVLDKDSLRQIRNWANSAALALKNESQQCFRDKRAMATIKPIIDDQVSFEMLSSAITDIIGE
jgi:hypothetical protein